MKAPTFKDRVKVYVQAGHGGNGCVSFRREKFVPRGGPDGGDGGRGGHIYLQADPDTDSLLALHFQPHQRAEHGRPGGSQRCTGRGGADLYVRVPPGTDVYDADAGERLGELVEPDSTLCVARGGEGGLGNCHFRTSSHQAPREHTEGGIGETRTLRLELKLVADIGLVGYPNAGKSTLLRAISAAKPKTAAYPFTTLNPVIGVVHFDDFRTLRVADIPGLIDGAHEGVGLGHDFLRHIERTKFLLFIIDMAGIDGRDPAEDYHNLRKELRLYHRELDHRPYAVVANKMDLDGAALHLNTFSRHTGEAPVAISAMQGYGIDELKLVLRDAFFSGASSHPTDEPPPEHT